MTEKYKVAIAVDKPRADTIFDAETIDFLSTFAEHNDVNALPEVMTREFMMEVMKDADAVITCWGTPGFTDEMLAQLPKLRLIAHAAGTIKQLVPDSFWKTNRRITSNAAMIADDVAQTTLALMLTSLKRLWEFNAITAQKRWKDPEMFAMRLRRLDGLNVGLVGASQVSKALIGYLKPFNCHVIVADPYMSPLEADMLGVKKMELNDMIPICDVISLHAPANEDCRHMLNAQNIPTMKDGALLINTARGMLIDEPALIRELQTGRIMACLDVTDPEPPLADNPLRTMPNVVLTPHRAGGHTENGRLLMGRNIVNETYNYLVKGLLKYDIRNETLAHMA